MHSKPILASMNGLQEESPLHTMCSSTEGAKRIEAKRLLDNGFLKSSSICGLAMRCACLAANIEASSIVF